MSGTFCYRSTHASQQADVQQHADVQQQQHAYASQAEALSPAQLAPCAITQLDFQAAVKKVQPSVRREGFATTPDVTWGDVGSLAEVCTLSFSGLLAQACLRSLPALPAWQSSVSCCQFGSFVQASA